MEKCIFFNLGSFAYHKSLTYKRVKSSVSHLMFNECKVTFKLNHAEDNEQPKWVLW